MKGIAIERFGGADELRCADWPRPDPGPGQARIRVVAAGVNFIDVYMRSGQYARSATYRTPLPMLLGMEGAGVVDAVGEQVTDIVPGDRVAWCIERGAYAEFAVVPAWKLVRVPDLIDWHTAAALMLQGCTAHYLTHSLFALQPGQTALVHAGAGGVGQLLIQLAKTRGARVIATVGNADKARIARERGADETVLYRDVDFREVVMSLTGGQGVDVVYDSVGRDTIHRSIRSLKRRGTCVMYGASSGQVDGIAPLELAEAGSVFFTRPHLADYLQPHEVRARGDALFAMVTAGRLKVAIDRVYPLHAVAHAHRQLESRGTRGKLLLDLGGDAAMR